MPSWGSWPSDNAGRQQACQDPHPQHSKWDSWKDRLGDDRSLAERPQTSSWTQGHSWEEHANDTTTARPSADTSWWSHGSSRDKWDAWEAADWDAWQAGSCSRGEPQPPMPDRRENTHAKSGRRGAIPRSHGPILPKGAVTSWGKAFPPSPPPPTLLPMTVPPPPPYMRAPPKLAPDGTLLSNAAIGSGAACHQEGSLITCDEETQVVAKAPPESGDADIAPMPTRPPPRKVSFHLPAETYPAADVDAPQADDVLLQSRRHRPDNNRHAVETPGPPLPHGTILCHEVYASPDILTASDFSRLRGDIHRPHSQHNQALKYIRDACEAANPPIVSVDMKRNTTYWIPELVSQGGPDYTWQPNRWWQWNWMDMLAQLGDDHLKAVVTGPNPNNEGIISCSLSMFDTHDHKRSDVMRQNGLDPPPLYEWHFVVHRADGGWCSLRPSRKSKQVQRIEQTDYAVAPQAPPPPKSARNPRGTYKRHKEKNGATTVYFDPQIVITSNERHLVAAPPGLDLEHQAAGHAPGSEAAYHEAMSGAQPVARAATSTEEAARTQQAAIAVVQAELALDCANARQAIAAEARQQYYTPEIDARERDIEGSVAVPEIDARAEAMFDNKGAACTSTPVVAGEDTAAGSSSTPVVAGEDEVAVSSSTPVVAGEDEVAGIASTSAVAGEDAVDPASVTADWSAATPNHPLRTALRLHGIEDKAHLAAFTEEEFETF